jgi:hypothetical protein
MNDIIVGGLYQHWKFGNLYKVLGVAHHTETNEELVIYQKVTGNELYARPKYSFLEIIDTVNDGYISRFEFVR